MIFQSRNRKYNKPKELLKFLRLVYLIPNFSNQNVQVQMTLIVDTLIVKLQ